MISNPTDFPDLSYSSNKVLEVQEPVVNATIIVPEGEHPQISKYRITNITTPEKCRPSDAVFLLRILWPHDGAVLRPPCREP